MARIGIDLERRIGTVDRRIFGQFIEHLGRCIYGGIYDEGSPLADARGFRTDVLDAVRPLRIPILRWPGGNFVSGYHWLDGVGPRDERPRRSELAWYAEESNRFGTDEFIEYCRAIEAEPYICVNMGSGTMDEAQAWVEYCNGTGNTSWANLRRANGHAERAIRIGAALIERVRKRQGITHPIHIAFDEWNVWYRTRSHEDRVGGLEERYDLTDALAIAPYLNGFIRHCREVRIANFAQLVNAIAPIFTDAKRVSLQTIYHPLRLYAEHMQAVALDVHVAGEAYDLSPAQEAASVGRIHHVSDLGPFQLLDAAATCDEAGRRLTLAIVNRERDRDLAATVDLGSATAGSTADVWEVNGPHVAATNSFEAPHAVDVRASRLDLRGSRFDYTFPAHSITLLHLPITR